MARPENVECPECARVFRMCVKFLNYVEANRFIYSHHIWTTKESHAVCRFRQGRDQGSTGLMKSIRQVEIQVPVYSRETWDCVYNMLDETSATGYGIDDYVHTCMCGVTEMYQVRIWTVCVPRDAFRHVWIFARRTQRQANLLQYR